MSWRTLVAAIRFGGLASGLPPNIVEQIMEAEKIPIQNMENKKGRAEARLALVNELDGKLNAIKDSVGTLASVRGFNDYKLLTGDNNVVQGVIDPLNTKVGSWNIEVMELAQKAAAITNGFPDKDRTEIGTGYFKFETTNGEKEVYINGASSTLEGAAKAINAAGIGVRASVINDRKNPEEPFKLMISGEDVGDENKVSYPTLYFLDGDQDLYFDEERPAKNGIVKIDGFEFEVSDNTVKDAIPGVTLDLKQAAPGKQVNVSVKEDKEVVSGKIKEFVTSVNGVLGFIQSQNRLTQETDTSKTLGGDSLLRTVENRFRNLIQSSQMGIDGPIKRLNQIGISFNRGGLLDLNEETFNSKLAQNPEGVRKFLAGDGFNVGFIPAMKNTLKNVQDGVFGPIGTRKKSLDNKIKQFNNRIEQKETQLAKKEQSLRRKFANLENTMSRLKSQMGQVQSMGGGGGGIPGLIG